MKAVFFLRLLSNLDMFRSSSLLNVEGMGEIQQHVSRSLKNYDQILGKEKKHEFECDNKGLKYLRMATQLVLNSIYV